MGTPGLDTVKLVGLMVGGKGTRMGGRNKGRLTRPDGQTLVGHLLRVCRQAGLEPCLVGGDQDWSDLAPGVPLLADEPTGVGPMGGLAALLRHAQSRPVVLLATDMPYLDATILGRLANQPSTAAVLAGQDPQTTKWFPFFARYDSRQVLPVIEPAMATGVRSFQTLFRELTVEQLPLSEEELQQLRDWDTPDDVEE